MEINASKLCDLFQSKEPFLVGRNGTIELEVLSIYLDSMIITQDVLNILEKNAGIFPSQLSNVKKWCIDYIKALSNTDMIAEGWYLPLKHLEKRILDSINPYRTSIMLRNLEPYYVTSDLRWTQYLKGKRVAIINSFAQTCEEQTYMSKAIWEDESESLLPSSTVWIPIQTYYSPALGQESQKNQENQESQKNQENQENQESQKKAVWPSNIHTYNDAVEYIVKQCLEESIDIAIIGCGGMGMIIGSKLKNKGKQCIVMGGATQILFGIKGKRWENHAVISKFFNDAWVYPPDTCKPCGYRSIEGGCYW
jgi:hypothetical protein